MKEAIKAYGELKNLISRGEKVTMQDKLMTHAKLSEMSLSNIKLFIDQGYFQVEHKSDLAETPAVEGEFIGKDDVKTNTHHPLSQQGAAYQAAMAQAQANMSATAAQGSVPFNNYFGSPIGLGGLFGRGR